MCFCNPNIRTPFCTSIECQLELERLGQKRVRKDDTWKFPVEGDLPDKMESILYVPTATARIIHGYYCGSSLWLSYEHGDSRPTTNVKCWMYAPEIPEHHTKKG